ncbi:MAG: thiamine pyrophosphate-dependent enzyme [Thermoprotei archaeon]
METVQREGLEVVSEDDIRDLKPYRVLGEDGSALREPSVSLEFLKRLYTDMVLARRFDERAVLLSSVREIGTYAPHMGQEATQVGIVRALSPSDWFVPMYRDNGAMITMGMPMESLLRYWGGDEWGLRVPENLKMLPFAIPVGTQIPHAAGLAMAQKLGRTGGAVVVTVGDGGTSKGDFHEGLNFAGVFGLPLVVGVENNQYAISLPREFQTHSKTIAQKALAYGVSGIIVDGNDAVAVYEATSLALKLARGGQPVLVEYVTYRRSYHTTAELVSHKLQPEEELKVWELRDPLLRVEKYLMSKGALTEEEKNAIYEEANRRVKDAVEKFRATPPPDALDIFRYMYSKPTPILIDEAYEAFGDAASKLVEDHEVNEDEKPVEGGKTVEVNIRNAVNITLRQEMERDPRILVYGEDVARNGGVFQVTRGLLERFGERVFDTPLAEVSIAGVFVGLAIGGYIPVAEFQFDGFTPPAYDQIFNHIARYRNRTRGRYPLRGVIRFPYGAVHSLEHHSDSPETYFAHTPGLKVVVPSNPFDAKGLLAAALRCEDPVVFMEPKRLYDAPKMSVPEDAYTVPIGKAKVVREGNDVTVVSYGAMLHVALEGAKQFSADVIDLRTISPLDTKTIISSVEKTGRLVIVHEAPRNLGVGAEIAAQVSDKALLSLKAPIKRVTSYDIVNPLAKLEDYNIPSPKRVESAIRQTLSY